MAKGRSVPVRRRSSPLLLFGGAGGCQVLATGDRNSASFDFFAADLDSGVSSPLGTVPRGASEEESAAFYAPYMTAVAADGEAVLRLGYQVTGKWVCPV